MTETYTAPVLDPPLDTWPALLAQAPVQSLPASLAQLRTAARKRLVESAEQFVLRLHAVAAKSGLPAPTTPVLTGDPERVPVVMTGHQPVIFHPGLVFKYDTTERFAAAQQAIAVAVIIDTDEGDGCSFICPAPVVPAAAPTRLPRLHMQAFSFSSRSGLYSHNQLLPRDQLLQVRDRAADLLSQCGLSSAAARLTHVAAQYAALQTTSAVEANAIVRWQAGIGARMLELPLSAICWFPEVLTLTADLLNRTPEFCRFYNQQLQIFRVEQRIRNPANPFPDLTVADDSWELPFWLVDDQSGRREAIRGRRSGQSLQLLTADNQSLELPLPITAAALEQLATQQRQLIPRGALITALLRLLFSDLFVHGTGGGRYDRFTSQLLRAWWHVEPTPFAVASASRYLLAQERQELQRLQQLSERLRDLTYHPQRFIGTGVYSSALETRLSSLLEQKAAALQAMQQARSDGQSAREHGQIIQRLTDDIRQAVTDEFQTQLLAVQQLSEAERETLQTRTWPWFFFDGPA